MSLGVWRDEAKGLINGKKPEELDDGGNIVDLTSDVEPASSPSRVKPPQSSSPATDHDMDMDMEHPTRPPSSGTDYDGDEGAFDLDAVLREQEEEELQKLRASAAAASARVAPKQIETVDDDEMDALWAELDNAPSGPASAPPPRLVPDEDEDMRDIMQDTEPEAAWVPSAAPDMAEVAAVLSPPSNAEQATTAPGASAAEVEAKDFQPATETRPTNDDDWDDMYQ